jgi:hypothetical protein
MSVLHSEIYVTNILFALTDVLKHQYCPHDVEDDVHRRHEALEI